MRLLDRCIELALHAEVDAVAEAAQHVLRHCVGMQHVYDRLTTELALLRPQSGKLLRVLRGFPDVSLSSYEVHAFLGRVATSPVLWGSRPGRQPHSVVRGGRAWGLQTTIGSERTGRKVVGRAASHRNVHDALHPPEFCFTTQHLRGGGSDTPCPPPPPRTPPPPL